ncbi:nuclear transport factor 2 family protein [Arthrobacter sp. CDRTa11]|uniref:nuclear transport factor 2 family protein n=1 Tax=Arthrobacter sp. CDRTa11 TaxID=2651199 RepID=UPI002265D471|nr:nuclear transport factor 2 family protein [Arthrobacter sp. CDRTa11]
MRASQEIVNLLTEYYAAMETNQPDRYGKYFAYDITLTFAPAPTITGRDAALTAMAGLLGRVRSLHHDLVNVWEEDEGVVIFESLGVWHLHNGRSVSIKACSVFTVENGKFTDQRIYVDNSPLFELLDEPVAASPSS